MVIGVAQVGIHDNFIELGGHSLLAIQVMARMREAYQVDLPVELLFKAPTVATLAEAVLEKLTEQTDGAALAQIVSELEQVSEEEALAMLAAQKL
jgi:acyl carrier protein